MHELWNELSTFEAGEWEKALAHLLQRLTDVVPALDAAWIGAVRSSNGPASPHGLGGWKPQAVQLLRAGPIQPARKPRGKGARELAACEFESSFEAHVPRGTRIALYDFMPITDRAASLIGLFRDQALPPFSDAEHELVHEALRGLKWFYRQVLLGHGLLLASAPLTARERSVLREMLRGQAEKHIAASLDLSYHSARQHVASIYRKFGINSRAELLALWLGKQP